MQNSVPEISVIGCGVCTLSHMPKPRTLLSGSTRNEPNKPTQLAKRTLKKVSRSNQYWFQLVTVISKMQAVLEFNDVRSVNVIRLDSRYDTQASCIRRAPTPSYADKASDSHLDGNGIAFQHVLTFNVRQSDSCAYRSSKCTCPSFLQPALGLFRLEVCRYSR
jgi:hypothetical protein